MHDQPAEHHDTKMNTSDDELIITSDEIVFDTRISSSYTRGLMWQANSQSVSLHLETIYGQLCDDHSPYERLIQRDLSRTFPKIDMFMQENGPGQQAMYRVLVAYSLYDAQVGYCQGLAFLVGPLLMNMPEPQAFCVFVSIMERYEMRSMFTLKMEGLQLRLYQFSCLLKDCLPKLAAHLDKHAVHPAMYASQWFLTLFAYVFPMDLVTNIYDSLFVEGAWETIMRVSIAMLQKSEQAILLENEFENLLDFVATRKLCTPYKNDWSDVISDAMALSNKVTRQKLDQLEQCYEQQGQQGKHQTQQAFNNNRLGSFWRRRKSAKRTTAKKSAMAPLPSSSRYNAIKDDASTNIHGIGINSHNAGNKLSSPTNTSHPSLSTSAPGTGSNTTSLNQELIDALDQLRKEHKQTMDELRETKLDKKDIENERDALKLTIMELEKRHHHRHHQSTSSSATIMEHSVSGTTFSHALDDDHTPYYYNGEILANYSNSKSPSNIVSCSSNCDMPSISGHRKPLSLSSSATTLINFTPTTTISLPPPLHMKKGLSSENASLLSSVTTSSWSVPYHHHHHHHFRIYSMDSQDDDDEFILTTPPMDDDDGNDDDDDREALRTELVRTKVDHFEAQQQCERLELEIENYQSRLDMVNEGQMALMDKLVNMTSEMEDMVQAKQRFDEKWSDLVKENSQLTMQLQQQQQQLQQATKHDFSAPPLPPPPPPVLSPRYLKAKIYHLETSLAATKVQLAELELLATAADPHQHHPSTSLESQESVTTICQQQHEHIEQQHYIDDDDDDETHHDPLIDARTVGNGRIGRSVTLYGRMWHAISPRSQIIGSS